MPPRPRPRCVVCKHQASRYTCASCRVEYCSVACYKTHKETCASGSTGATSTIVTAGVLPAQTPSEPLSNPEPTPEVESTRPADQPLQDPVPLRPLTSLQWPYVPDTSAYPDPLTRDDPKPLQMHQYEAIATSPTVRTLLENPNLCTLLTTIDTLRGSEREEALQRALGVESHLLINNDASTALDDDTRSFRAFAEAVEQAVRGGREDALGLDWD